MRCWASTKRRGRKNRRQQQPAGQGAGQGRLTIITTLQKFPYVLSKVGEPGNRHFALILDEAHSSQPGTAAVKLREVLTTDGKPPRAEAQLAPDTDYEKAAQENAELTGEELINNEKAKLGKNEGVNNFDIFGKLSTGAQGWKCPDTAMPASAPREFSSIKSGNYPARRGGQVSNFSTPG